MTAPAKPTNAPREPVSERISGDTVAFVTVLHVSRSSAGKPSCARLHVEGILHDVEIPESHAAKLHAAAQTSEVLAVGLHCEWKQEPTGLELVSAKLTSIDSTFRPTCGADLLQDIARSSLPFTRSDYEEALGSLRERAPTKRTDSGPITLTLKEVLEGAKRAEDRVSRWPEWKRELSPSTWSERSDRRGSKSDGGR